MIPEWAQLVAMGLIGLGTGFLSGISGGGGGMLAIPLAIALGLTPQQAVATGKMGGLGAAFGGLSVFFKSGHIRRDILKIMLPIAIVIGIAAPIIFTKINSEAMQTIIGCLLLVVAPLSLFKKQFQPSKHKQRVGYFLYSLVLLAQAIFGTGVGSLSLFVLTLVLGTSKLEANATKRAVTAVLTPITFVGLLATGFVLLWHGLCLMIGTFIGTHLGSKIAVKKGETFVAYAITAVAMVSGVILILM